MLKSAAEILGQDPFPVKVSKEDPQAPAGIAETRPMYPLRVRGCEAAQDHGRQMPKVPKPDPLEVGGELPQAVLVEEDRRLPEPLLFSEVLDETGCDVFEGILGFTRPPQPEVSRDRQPEHLLDGIAHALPDLLALIF